MPLSVSPIGSSPSSSPTGVPAPKPAEQSSDDSFGSLIAKSIDSLSSAQSQVDAGTIDFVAGGETELHNLMIASEKVSLGVELAVQLRNKAVEAYQEIMRTQV